MAKAEVCRKMARPRKPVDYHPIFGLFSLVERETAFEDGSQLVAFGPELTELQKQLLDLLGVPMTVHLPS